MSRQAQEGALSPSTTENMSSRTTSNKRTAAQLEKKRAQDRDSQRNVRQRTKHHIAKLEAQVQELAAPDCVSRLLRANEDLQKRNDELTAILRSMSQLANQAVSPSVGSSAAVRDSPRNGESRSPPVSTNSSTKETHQHAKNNAQSPCSLSPDSKSGPRTTRYRPLNEDRHTFRAQRADSSMSNVSLASNASGETRELPNTILQLATEAPDCWCTPSPAAVQSRNGAGLDGAPNDPAERSIQNETGSHFKSYDWLASDFIGNIRQYCHLMLVQVLKYPSAKLRTRKVTQRYP